MTRMDKVGRFATTISEYDNEWVVTYHSTNVIRVTNEQITLNSGGWRTNTTKNRMNQTSNQFGLGYRVFQKNFEWFVEFKGRIVPFRDGMVIHRVSGNVYTKYANES